MAFKLTSFSGSYKFLSNFYQGIGGDVTINGIHYPTTEHAFQAGKFVKRSHRRAVAGCVGPSDSKTYARKLAAKIGNRAGWKDLDISILWMLKVLRLKFSHPLMSDLLLATKDRPLIEGNRHGDDFWGKIQAEDGSGLVGQNWLGIILMHIREELRVGKRIPFIPNDKRKLAQ